MWALALSPFCFDVGPARSVSFVSLYYKGPMSCACVSSGPSQRAALPCGGGAAEAADALQRKIHGQVGAKASTYVGLLGAVTAAAHVSQRWHAASDRSAAARAPRGAGGRAGVDVKHGSYARRLHRISAPAHLSEAPSKAAAVPRSGDKRRMVGLSRVGPSAAACCA